MRFIDGFGLAGYRSFGSPIIRIGPFEKINFFVGANNSGKSNILRFLDEHYHKVLEVANRGKLEFEYLDRHRRGEPTFRVEFGLRVNRDVCTKRISSIEHKKARETAERILKSHVLTEGKEIAWFPYVEHAEGTLRGDFSQLAVQFRQEIEKKNLAI